MHNDFYKRQIILDEVGVVGQIKLLNSSILVIGAGGLGHPALQYLAGAGIGKIDIIDNDKVDITNLHRQVLFTPADVNQNKAIIIGQRLKEQNPLINVNSIQTQLNQNNITILKQYDLILDCTDNFYTKFLVHDYCFQNKINLIQGSIHKFEGTLNTFKYAQSTKLGCLRCLWNEIPEADCVGTCSEVGVFGAIAGVMGSLQAEIESLVTNKTLTFDLRSLETQKISWKKNANCPLCSGKAVKNINSFEVDSIKEMVQVSITPSFDLDEFIDECDQSKNYVFTCSRGIASYRTVKLLRNEGLKNCFSLRGGISGIS